MNKCIDEIKREAVIMSKHPYFSKNVIIKKPTKKKMFIGKIIISNYPSFSLYINNKFYSFYILKNNKWETIRSEKNVKKNTLI